MVFIFFNVVSDGRLPHIWYNSLADSCTAVSYDFSNILSVRRGGLILGAVDVKWLPHSPAILMNVLDNILGVDCPAVSAV